MEIELIWGSRSDISLLLIFFFLITTLVFNDLRLVPTSADNNSRKESTPEFERLDFVACTRVIQLQLQELPTVKGY